MRNGGEEQEPSSLLLQEELFLASEVLVAGAEEGRLRAGDGVLRVVADEPLLVEHGARGAHEGELPLDVHVVVDVGEAHVEDGAAVELVGVVAVGQVAAVEAVLDAAEDQRGVGRQLVEERRRVTAHAQAGQRRGARGGSGQGYWKG